MPKEASVIFINRARFYSLHSTSRCKFVKNAGCKTHIDIPKEMVYAPKNSNVPEYLSQVSFL